MAAGPDTGPDTGPDNGPDTGTATGQGAGQGAGTAPRRRSHWAWGHEDELLRGAALAEAVALVREAVGLPVAGDLEEPVPFDRVRLPAPGVAVPARLAGVCSTGAHDRAVHALGHAYRDMIRAFRGRFDAVPDVVARPRTEDEIAAVLDWCAGAGVAVVPYGGGTSVVGGIEPRIGSGYAGAVSLDLCRFSRVREVDPVSRAALIEAGATGPVINQALDGHGLMLRHFPQSYEFSTLGGWIATRAGGHYATLYTHIDDFVESIRAVTPRGVWQSRRLPGSGAGISPDRMLLGSEGTLGVITAAWVRVQPRPRHRATAAVRFRSFAQGAEAVRAIAQAGLFPANCRLIDATEARLTAGGDGEHALLVLGLESADHPVDHDLARAVEIVTEHQGEVRRVREGRSGQAGAWRDTFVRMPYLRNVYPAMGLLAETFETAITWDSFAAADQAVLAATGEALRRVCGAGQVTRRFTFVYPDGPAPYYTVLAPVRRGAEVEQWDEVKREVSAALLAAGATITHHHAVGRDHRPWYDMQRPDPFAAALRGAKAALDPRGILNPGVLLDP